MGYDSMHVEGDLSETLKARTEKRYGKVVDMEVVAVDEGGYAAIAFVAVEMKGRKGGAPTVDGLVYLLKHSPGGVGGDCTIKELHETEGPVAAFCPARILDVLSPTGHSLALDWRERCRDWNAANPESPARRMH